MTSLEAALAFVYSFQTSARRVWPLAFIGIFLVAVQVSMDSAEPADSEARPITIRDLRLLSKEQVQTAPSIRIRGVVTYYDPKWDTLFVQDETAGVYVFSRSGTRPVYRLGQTLEVRGRPVGGVAANSIVEDAITVTGLTDLPSPKSVTLRDMWNTDLDSQFVEIEGTVRSLISEQRRTEIQIVANGGRFVAHLPQPPDTSFPADLLHARVRIRGVCGAIFDPRDRLTGVRLFVGSRDLFTVLVPGTTNGFTLPLTSLPNAELSPIGTGSTPRVHIRGTVTLSWSSGRVFLQEGNHGMEIEVAWPRRILDPEGVAAPNPAPVQLSLGDRIDAVGYPAERRSGVVLEEAEVRVEKHGILLSPEELTDVSSSTSQQFGELITVEAVLMEVLPPDEARPGLHRYLLRSSGTFFESHLEHGGAINLPLLPESTLRLNGVWTRNSTGSTDQSRCQLLLREPSDITILRGPPIWLTREALHVLGISAGIGIIALGYIVLLRRQVRLQAERIGALNRETELQAKYRELYEELRTLNTELEDRVANRTRELQCANQELQAEVEERIRAEASLREREQQQRAIFDNQSDLTWMKDREGHYIAVNQAFARELGWSREQVDEKTDFDLFPRELAKQFRDNDILVMEARQTRRFEETYPAKSGQLVSVETIKSPIFNDLGDVTGTVGVARDITERKRAEAELLNALAKEKELSQLKSNFVSLVSHEFRTPLEIIMSSAEILDRYLDRLNSEKRHGHLQAIHKSVRRMANLMEEVLLLGRVEAGKVEFRPELIDLEGLCRKLTDEIQVATNHQNPVILSVNVDSAAGASADENLLRHIFTNLLSNAIKYSQVGSPVEFTVQRKGSSAIFRVIDQGCGIPATDQERLFQAFYRGQNTAHIQGTGLGLVIVKRCVVLHGGTISCESFEGKGTTFIVTLPLFSSS